MKLAFFDDFLPGLVAGDRVIDISAAVRSLNHGSPQLLMADIIEHFDALAPDLRALARGTGVPLGGVRLRAPLPSPGKLLGLMGGYMEFVPNGVRKGIDWFLKAPSAVIGPGDTVVLPRYECKMFHHEAELAVVIGRRAKDVPERDAMRHVFGYTNFIDVSGHGFPIEGSIVQLPSFIGKSFDTFAPMGPWITTADEVPDVTRLSVRLWAGGQLRHDYNTADAEYPIARLLSFASSIMTLHPGDVLTCGTNHQGIGPIQHGDVVEMEIEGCGRLSVHVHDPLKRAWERGIDTAMAERVRSRRIPPA
jgi:2-keto-4-pentenoate hydratase/2-oxohepta-3-ene-1,7-dioic acid hydratase in catechol pathway